VPRRSEGEHPLRASHSCVIRIVKGSGVNCARPQQGQSVRPAFRDVSTISMLVLLQLRSWISRMMFRHRVRSCNAAKSDSDRKVAGLFRCFSSNSCSKCKQPDLRVFKAVQLMAFSVFQTRFPHVTCLRVLPSFGLLPIQPLIVAVGFLFSSFE
jgi:hypothetical protein